MGRPAGTVLGLALLTGIAALWLSPAAHQAEHRPLASVQTPASEAVVREGSSASGRQGSIPLIRVRLSTRQPDRLTVRIEGQYQARSLGDWWVLAQGAELPEAVVVVGKEGGLRIGSQTFPAPGVHLEVRQSGTLWVDGHQYRGSLNLSVKPDGTLLVVNVVDLEAYLASVLPSEMPADFPIAAQLAQVVTARTYALYQMKTYGRGSDFDIYDSARSQTYLGLRYFDREGALQAIETKRSRACVDQTRGLVLGYQGSLFCAHYSAVCGGHTASGQSVFGQAAAPLVGVPCGGCDDAPNFSWQRTFPVADVSAKLDQHLARLGRRVGAWEAIAVKDPGGGLMPAVELSGDGGKYNCSTAKFRSLALGTQVPSAFFAVSLSGQSLEVSGRGWGHGVGLCQWGARGLAARGKTAAQILAHYFPASELMRVE